MRDEETQLLGRPLRPSQRRTRWPLIVMPVVILVALLLILQHHHDEELEWKTCSVDGKIECARIDVPLTYEDGDDRTISLPLARVRGNRSAGNRPIFQNPGGPGGSGVNLIYRNGVRTADRFNGTRDIISWDPRGINGSIPSMECYASGLERGVSAGESGGMLSSAADSYERAMASNKVQSRGCGAISGEIGNYISTYYVVHDLRFIAAKMQKETPEKVKVDYWGYSYGTLLGMTFAKVFPDNIGNFVVDGVAHLHDYYKGDWGKNLYDTEAVIDKFFESCAASSKCELHKYGTPKQIRQRVDELLQEVKKSPLPAFHGRSGGLITYSRLKEVLIHAFYFPDKWPKLAHALALLLDGKADEFWKNNGDLVSSTLGSEGGLATACGDAAGHSSILTPDDLKKHEQHNAKQSPFYAEYWSLIPARCVDYPFKPSKRLDLERKVDGRDILFVGNQYDLVTPQRHAVTYADHFGGQVLRINGSYGHCSDALKSACAVKRITSWLDGDRSEPGYCGVDQIPFESESEPEQVFVAVY
ncbi:hypothetical protein PYCC9005_005477 [Savitreella phatthalungensis]